VNNYRAIALSNYVSKILETLLFDFIETSDAVDNYQFGLGKINPLPYARMFLRRQLITMNSMAVTFLLALLTPMKPLIALIIGCCSPSLLTLMTVFLVYVPHVCLLHGIVVSSCVCAGKVYALTILMLTKVCGKVVYCHLFSLVLY